MLLSYSKLVVFQQLLDSDIPEDPYLSKELQRYFPSRCRRNTPTEMEKHRLKREIIATAVTNSTINRMGATFLLRMQEDTGRSPARSGQGLHHHPRDPGRARVVGRRSMRWTARCPSRCRSMRCR